MYAQYARTIHFIAVCMAIAHWLPQHCLKPAVAPPCVRDRSRFQRPRRLVKTLPVLFPVQRTLPDTLDGFRQFRVVEAFLEVGA